MPKPWILLDAPMSMADTSAGTRKIGAALRQMGLAGQIATDRQSDHDGGALIGHLGRVLDAGERPMIFGDDCGIALAARALVGRGRFALAYIDAHSDFSHADNLDAPPATARSEAALLTGRGGRGVFRDEDAALIGFRKDDPALFELKKTSILLWPMFWLYEHSRIELDNSLLRRFDRPEIDGIWIHIDADALDPTVISAVQHPIADGLAPPELAGILRVLLGTGKVAGMSIANLSTGQDADGRQAAVIADVLAEALAA